MQHWLLKAKVGNNPGVHLHRLDTNCGAATCRGARSWKREALCGLRTALQDAGGKRKKGKGRKEGKRETEKEGRRKEKRKDAS